MAAARRTVCEKTYIIKENSNQQLVHLSTAIRTGCDIRARGP